jgi:hypothetical protein
MIVNSTYDETTGTFTFEYVEQPPALGTKGGMPTLGTTGQKPLGAATNVTLPKRFSVTLTSAELAEIPGAKVDTVSRIAYVDSSQLIKLNKAAEVELPKQEPKSSIVEAAVWNPNDTAYQAEEPVEEPTTPPPPTPETDTQKYTRLDMLVQHIQRTMIFYAYHRFNPLTDLETSDAGRKMTVTETQKTPFEWMLDRNDDAIEKQAYEFTDLLLDFIIENATQYSVWLPEKQYNFGNITRHNSLYYICHTPHISIDFDTETTYWTEIARETYIIFWQFTESPEYIEYATLFVPNAETYSKVIDIQ